MIEPCKAYITSLKRHIDVTIYALSFLLLFSAAVWNTASNITDYLFDNRLTTVQIKYVKNCSAFVHDPILIVRYDGRKSLYRETWSMNESKVDAIRMSWIHNSLIDNFCDPHYNVTNNFSVPDGMAIAEIYDLFWKIDTGLIKSQPDLDEEAHRLGIGRSRLDSFLDKFSKNPRCVENLLSDLWTKLRPNFVELVPSDGQMNGNNATAAAADRSPKCLSIGSAITVFRLRLRRDIRNGANDAYQLDRRKLDKYTNISTSYIDTAAAFMQFVFPENFEYHFDVPDGQTAEITVQISNAGVYDSHAFPPCTNDFPTKEECLADVEAKTYGDVCNCVPSKDRLSFRNGSSSDWRPYCTLRDYESCRDKAAAESAQRRSLAEQSCTPCQVVKNDYLLSSRFAPVQYHDHENAFKNDQTLWYNRALLTFTCLDQIYTYYEDKPQVTLTDLLSNIGGNLGLYLGFSLLHVLAVILFVYGLYYHQRKTKSYPVSVEEDVGKRRWSSIGPIPIPYSVQFALDYMNNHKLSLGDNSDDPIDNNTRQQDRAALAESRRKISLLEEQIKELNEKIDLQKSIMTDGQKSVK